MSADGDTVRDALIELRGDHLPNYAHEHSFDLATAALAALARLEAAESLLGFIEEQGGFHFSDGFATAVARADELVEALAGVEGQTMILTDRVEAILGDFERAEAQRDALAEALRRLADCAMHSDPATEDAIEAAHAALVETGLE